MPEAKGMWEGLMDFSLYTYATPRMLKFLYALHLLVGLVAAVTWVVVSFQQPQCRVCSHSLVLSSDTFSGFSIAASCLRCYSGDFPHGGCNRT
jgi:hypothetical protein